MPQLHARGVELLVDLLDTAEHVDRLTPAETKALLTEVAMVLGELLKRDLPEGRRDDNLQVVLDRPSGLSNL